MAFPLIPVLIAVGVSFALSLAATLLMRPKTPGPGGQEVAELELPMAEAGVPIPVVFGTVTITAPNVLWRGERTTKTYSIDAEEAEDE